MENGKAFRNSDMYGAPRHRRLGLCLNPSSKFSGLEGSKWKNEVIHGDGKDCFMIDGNGE